MGDSTSATGSTGQGQNHQNDRRTFMSRKNSWEEPPPNHQALNVVSPGKGTPSPWTTYRNVIGKRVFIGQVGLGVTAVFFSILHLLGVFNKRVEFAVTLAALYWLCFVMFLVFLGLLMYKNFSVVIFRRILRESNLTPCFIMLFLYVLVDLSSLRAAARHEARLWKDSAGSVAEDADGLVHESGFIVYSVGYVIGVAVFLISDAIELKSRIFVMATAFLFVTITTWNVFYRLGWHHEAEASFELLNIKGVTVDKESTKGMFFMAIFSLSLKGLTAIVSDHGMDKMVFVLQHSVVLDRRRLSAAIQHRRSSSKIKKDGANHNPSNSLEDLDMEFEDDGAPSNCSRKAWATRCQALYRNTALRRKWSSICFCVSFVAGAFAYILITLLGIVPSVATQFGEAISALSLAGVLVSVGGLFYDNTSEDIVKRIIKSPQIQFIFSLLVLLVVVDIVAYDNFRHRCISLVYLVSTMLVIFVSDAVVYKPQYLVVTVAVTFTVLTLFNMVVRTFVGVESSDMDIRYLDYNGSKKRISIQSLKRSAFINVFLLMFKGLYTFARRPDGKDFLLKRGTRHVTLQKFERLLFIFEHLDRTTGGVKDVCSKETVLHKLFYEQRQEEIRAVLASHQGVRWRKSNRASKGITLQNI